MREGNQVTPNRSKVGRGLHLQQDQFAGELQGVMDACQHFGALYMPATLSVRGSWIVTDLPYPHVVSTIDGVQENYKHCLKLNLWSSLVAATALTSTHICVLVAWQ